MTLKPRTWSLPIRKWLVLALVILVIVPVFVTAATAFHLLGNSYTDKAAVATLIQDDVAQWNDPHWQSATRDRFSPHGVDFVLTEDGKTIYSSSADPLSGSGMHGGRTVQEYVVSASNPEQKFYIYSDQYPGGHSNIWVLPIVAFTTLLLTLAGIAWFIGHTVLRPLAATGEAARLIADGNLDFEVPTSRVREVADVTGAFAAMSDALRESLGQQAKVEQERRLFISAIVHDLRTPVFALRGYLEGLQTGVADTPKKRSRYVEIAQDKASDLERLITDLFEFTRLEYLEQAPNRAVLDLGVLLTRLVESLQPQSEAKGVELTVSPLPEQCTVFGDSHLLSRAAENLLVNALRHTPSGGRIWVECSVEPLWVRFSVFDTGTGIPATDLPQIFTPLFRGEQSRNRRTGGVGLGLTIARSILLAHDGDLTAGNHDGGGAVFSGSLPRAARHVSGET
ncbi:MAG TPA: HAMP domain-containing sensor histidine kinase [Nitrolancea sp.]|nr:HAMP domain-containing sensor histidine kinase [Nitrolancea sp.]